MSIRKVYLLALLLGITACESSGGSSSGSSFSSYMPRQSSFSCDDGSTLTLQRTGSMLTASDTRGFSATLQASPPGQATRFAEGIHALILEGRDATWFVSGQQPLECRR
jgi:hypothetical protein